MMWQMVDYGDRSEEQKFSQTCESYAQGNWRNQGSVRHGFSFEDPSHINPSHKSSCGTELLHVLLMRIIFLRFSTSFLLICSYLLCNIGNVFSRDCIAPKLPYLTQCRNCKQRGSIYYFISEISFLAPRLFYSLICKCRLYFSFICKD